MRDIIMVDRKKLKKQESHANFQKSSVSPRHTSISQSHTLTNQRTNATSIASAIISFYCNRKFKNKEKL